jgi:hypothetical protein
MIAMIAFLAWLTFWFLMVGVTIVAASVSGNEPKGDDFWVYIFGWPMLLPVAIYEWYVKVHKK